MTEVTVSKDLCLAVLTKHSLPALLCALSYYLWICCLVMAHKEGVKWAVVGHNILNTAFRLWFILVLFVLAVLPSEIGQHCLCGAEAAGRQTRVEMIENSSLLMIFIRAA